ncbi:hypothetical protein [Noviherbaspirillum sp. UKPF54]|uniref:hypothetical protein n=1 Tax=Noviherbaspirillum sp. UKPF54 TaxID=2601898 RepID=UPI001AF006BD|nr:hypothetical protein [Noviherbaspirillum sp. UKPF54]
MAAAKKAAAAKKPVVKKTAAVKKAAPAKKVVVKKTAAPAKKAAAAKKPAEKKAVAPAKKMATRKATKAEMADFDTAVSYMKIAINATVGKKLDEACHALQIAAAAADMARQIATYRRNPEQYKPAAMDLALAKGEAMLEKIGSDTDTQIRIIKAYSAKPFTLRRYRLQAIK